MRYPVDNIRSWYVALTFGQPVSYGFHDGEDLNLISGGNTDLGQPLYAIADGTITSVELLTGSPTFGKHIHLKFEGAWGTRWAHYGHCNEVFVQSGQTVKEGTKIATVGRTGTTIAHCHFAIKNAPTGINGIAKTLADLAKWENPMDFISYWIGKADFAITNQTRIPQIENKEVGAIASELKDLRRNLADEQTGNAVLKAQVVKYEAALGEFKRILDNL